LSHYPCGPINTQHFGLPVYRKLYIWHCKHSTRPDIKPEVQWRQNSSGVWVHMEKLRNWTYSNRGQVVGEEINDGGWTDASCRGSVDMETASELWRIARQTERERNVASRRREPTLLRAEPAGMCNFLDVTNSSC
jgi:hypothetical protein